MSWKDTICFYTSHQFYIEHLKSKLGATSQPLEKSPVPVINNNKDWLTGVQWARLLLIFTIFRFRQRYLSNHVSHSIFSDNKNQTALTSRDEKMLNVSGRWRRNEPKTLLESLCGLCTSLVFDSSTVCDFMVFSANVYDVTVFVLVQQKQQNVQLIV